MLRLYKLKIVQLNWDYSIEQETCAEGGIMIHIHSQNGMGYYGYDWLMEAMKTLLHMPIMKFTMYWYQMLIIATNS